MRYSAVVLNVWALGLYFLAFGLLLLAAILFVVGALDLNPFGILGWLIEIYAIHFGIPLALILALSGAVIQQVAHRIELHLNKY